jgi:hypothetical protein
MATALGQAEARGDGISIAGVIATWVGRCPLSIGAAVVEAAAGEAEEARMTVARWKTMLQTWPPEKAAAGTTCGGRSRLVPHQIRGRKAVVVINDYECKDPCNPMTARAAAAADGNDYNSKNNSDDDNDRQTSSTWSNFIVRILFLTLLLLAYSKLY